MSRKPRQPGHGFEFRVSIQGRRFSKSFHDRKAGAMWARDLRSGAERGAAGLPTGGTFADACRRYLEDRPTLAPSTRDLYRSYWLAHLQPAWGARHLEGIRPTDIRSWVAHLQRSLAGATVSRLLALCRGILRHAVATGMLASDPSQGITLARTPRLREVRMLTDAEIERVLEACRTPRLRALVSIVLGTGLRLGELRALSWEWIDWDRRVLRVPASLEAEFVPKGKTSREIPLDLGPDFPDVLGILRSLTSGPPGTGRIFAGRNFQRWARSIRQRSGVRFRWHLLRHTFLSRLVMLGVPLRTAQAIAGHRSITTTEIYSHLSPDVHDQVRGILARRWGTDGECPKPKTTVLRLRERVDGSPEK